MQTYCRVTTTCIVGAMKVTSVVVLKHFIQTHKHVANKQVLIIESTMECRRGATCELDYN